MRERPIEDYALIGDCHSSALVSRAGSIDWCCTPRFDAPSVFGRLLDIERGGYCSIDAPDASVERRYLDRTLVLETTFRTATGDARLLDFFAMHEGGRDRPYRQLIRIVEGMRGNVELSFHAAPRFDYGEAAPWFRREGAQLYSAIGGAQGLLFAFDFPVARAGRHDLDGTIRLRAGERAHVSIRFVEPATLDREEPVAPGPNEADERLEETIAWWRAWADRTHVSGPDAAGVIRSAIVLKALTYAPTGAIVAAPTTSLPETIPGSRNWDYRYSWVRDSVFTVRSMFELGFESEPEAFRTFVERSAAGTGAEMQVLFGVAGERRLNEVEIELAGYRGCAPVRIGNQAARQLQLDVYGEMLGLAWHWYARGRSPDDDYWEFIVELVDTVCDRWTEPDRGIWELRSDPQHFVHSKVMCWAALDRGVRLAEKCKRSGPTERWERTRKEVREAIEADGYDRERGVFVRAFGSSALDASLLLIPTVGFCSYDDDRMVRTADAIANDLASGGLLLRYDEDDGLGPAGSAFLPCSFWLAECYARQGRHEEARAWFDRTVAAANDLGLFSEQYDAGAGEARGNFPQGFTHLSHIAAAVAISEGRSRTGIDG